MSTQFPNFPGPFVRDPDSNKIVVGKYSTPALEATATLPWLFTEKIDGTPVRIKWDGHRVQLFSGRTRRGERIPTPLYDYLHFIFGTEEGESLFVEKFGLNAVTLFAEGFGPKLKDAGKYSRSTRIALFDVQTEADYMQPSVFMLREEMEDLAEYFDIEVVPAVLEGTIQDAIDLVKAGYTSIYGDFKAEGLVGVTKAGLRDRAGERIAVKIDAKDYA